MNREELELMVMNLYPCYSMDEVWLEVIRLMEKQNRNIKTNTNKYYWITINPKDDITLTDFISQVNKVVNMKIFNKCIFSFEQRGETTDTMGTGLHCHILACNDKYSVSNFCSNTRKHFIKFVGNINTHVWIVKIPEEWKNEKIDYIRGLKWDPEKDQKIIIDREWRREHQIEPYYTKAWDFSTSEP